ncbi:MAG: hypothetical protein ABSB19_16990 [Methylomonas sp.]|jgi:hypothetical protein
MLISDHLHSFERLTADDRALAEILCSGSDERTRLNYVGLNKYGGTTFPRQTIAFGSCTNSTITDRGWDSARKAWDDCRRRMAEAGELTAADEIGRHVRGRLLELMELTDIDGLKVVLTPSGTDAESIATFFASLSNQGKFVNIVMGAREVGSGTALAAGVRYFSETTPAGRKCTPGGPIDADLAERVSVRQIKIRVDSAAVRSPEDLDREIKQSIESSLSDGANIILHIVAHSKTGVHAPRLETVNELIARNGKRIVAIIDAAQGRFSRRGLREYLSRGCMVILTGSKFYGGPPFSGCLLIPKNLIPADPGEIVFPLGFSDYLTPAQLPVDWTVARNSLNPATNFGLLLRWLVALEEMRAYYATPDFMRYKILRFFESQAPIILGRSPLLELINPPMPIFDNGFERLLESKTTVFGFRIRSVDGGDFRLEQPALERWVNWLNQDISGVAPPSTPEDILQATRTCFQLGQAVHVGERTSGQHDYVIRVAIGGLLIAQLATDLDLGANLETRLAWLEEKLEHLRLKLEFIAKKETALLNCEESKLEACY